MAASTFLSAALSAGVNLPSDREATKMALLPVSLLWKLLSRAAAVTLGLFFGKKSELLFLDTSLILGKLAVTTGTIAIQKIKISHRNFTENLPIAEKNLKPLCSDSVTLTVCFLLIPYILTDFRQGWG